MSKNEKTFNSFKEFSDEYIKENKEILEIQKLLNSYGLDIPLELIPDIEIIEKNRQLLTYYNKKTNEIVTSDLLGRIHEKWDARYSVSLTTRNQNKTFFVEQFNDIGSTRTYEEAGKNALKSRKQTETRLLSRAYADISTKYGDFCLHIEQEYTNYKFGPYRSISLYYGNHEQVLIDWKNDFDFRKYCLFRYKYNEKSKFSQCTMGLINVKFDAPRLNIWNYGVTKNSDIPIYSMEENHNSGAIFINGTSKLEENFKYIPRVFDFRGEDLLKQFEDKNCTSKAYFCNYRGEYVAILKQGTTISIEYKKEISNIFGMDNGQVNCFSASIPSFTTREFTKNDFENIIKIVEESSISNELKRFVISQLNGYINTHNENDFKSLNLFPLECYNFEDILQYIQQSNLVEVVETGLESLSKKFHIDMEDLLGQNPPNQTKNLNISKK